MGISSKLKLWRSARLKIWGEARSYRALYGSIFQSMQVVSDWGSVGCLLVPPRSTSILQSCIRSPPKHLHMKLPLRAGGVGSGDETPNRPTSVILSLVKSQAPCHILQETGLWEFPDEAWYPHPNSVQQHGHLKNRAWACAPMAGRYLLALTSIHRK